MTSSKRAGTDNDANAGDQKSGGPDTGRRRGRPSKGQSESLTETIVVVAGRLFLEAGFSATSMDAVAAQTGSSKRTLYARFPSKFVLFEEVIRRFSHAQSDDLAAFETRSGPIAPLLREIAHVALERALQPASISLFRLLVAEAHRFPDLTSAGQRCYLDPMAEPISRVLAAAVERGELIDRGVGLMAEQFLEAVCSLEVRRVALGYAPGGMTPGRSQRIEQVVEMFLGGVRSPGPQPA